MVKIGALAALALSYDLPECKGIGLRASRSEMFTIKCNTKNCKGEAHFYDRHKVQNWKCRPCSTKQQREFNSQWTAAR